MKPRILAVDDETDWLENFRAWIPEDIAIQDSASTTLEAIGMLRRYRYNVALLDLSMDPGNQFNRDNRVIQEYLATWPEGTRYIIVSGTADKADVRDSAYHLHASDVIFKAEIEPAILKETVTRAIEEASTYNDKLVADARRKLMDVVGLSDRILATLNPKDGIGSLYPMMETMFRRIAPLASHENRPHFEIWNDCVVGLAWSRQLGTAVSMMLASANLTEEESLRRLEDWLGYSHQNDPLFSREGHRIRIRLFEEPNVSDAHFELPVITVPSA